MQKILPTSVAAALLAALLLLAACSSGADMATRDLPPTQAHALIEQHANAPDFAILDVRTPREFAAGHLSGARLLDYYDKDFKARLAALDRDKTWLVYCRTGNRSGKTFPVMQKLGFADVYHLSGGITAWTRAGLPTTR